MLRDMWRRLWSPHTQFSYAGRQRARRQRKRSPEVRSRLALETLEDRILPSIVNWIGGSGDWSTASNWLDATTLTNHVPGAADDAVINVAGISVTHSSGSDTVNSLTMNDPFTLSGGTLALAAGGTDTVQEQSGNAFTLAGGTLSNATIVAGTTLVANNDGGNTLSGVTLNGTLDMATSFASHVTVTNGMTVNGLVRIGSLDGANLGQLQFATTQTLAGTGDILFGGSQFDSLAIPSTPTPTTVTIGNGLTLHGKDGTIGTPGGGAFINQGTVGPDVAGGLFTLDGTDWSNGALGTIQAAAQESVLLRGSWSNTGTLTVNGGTLYLSGAFTTAGSGIFAPAPAGNFRRTGGTVNLVGVLNNSGSTLALDARTGAWNFLGATGSESILGGIITTSGSNDLVPMGHGAALNHVMLNGTLDMASSPATVAVTNGLTVNGQVLLGSSDGANVSQLQFSTTQTLAGSGEIRFGGSQFDSLDSLNGTTTLTLAAGLTLHGRDGTIGTAPTSGGGTFINQATITVENGGQFTFNGTNWTNAGSIQTDTSATASIILRGTFTNPGTIQSSTGFIYLSGVLDNRGRTLALNDSTGSWLIERGEILGGVVSTAGSAKLVAFAVGSTLDGVTLAGTLDMTNNQIVSILHGLTLNNGLISLAGSSVLSFQGAQTLAGAGVVTLNNVSGGEGLLVPTAGDTLIIGPNVVVQGNSGFVGSLTGGAFTNQGTISATGGGTLTAQGDTNFAVGTLTGGTWQAAGNSTLRLLGANLVSNAANLLLDGPSAHLFSDTGATSALANLAGNAATGRLAICNGYNLAAPSAFSNQGSMTIGPGSTLTAAGSFATDGATVVDGSLVAGSTVTTSATGTLGGVGTVTGNVVNDGTVSPGDSPGLLTIQGSYTQGPAGILNLEIGGPTAGSQYDELHITGQATLAGTCDITLVNGFGPTVNQTFPVLTSGSLGGTFATVNGLQNGRFPLFSTAYAPTGLTLTALTTTADLAFDSFDSNTFPTSASAGQNVSVRYSVRNTSSTPATGDWYDSLYFSASPVLDSSAMLLGRVHHSGDVTGLATYSETLTAPVPNLADGGYHVILVADSRGLVPDINRTNNTGVSPNLLHVSVPLLTIGAPITGTIVNGQDLYYRLVVPPSQALKIAADFAVARAAEFDLRYNALPDRSTFDHTYPNVADRSQSLFLPSPQGGTYYVLLHGREGAPAAQSFTLRADAASFELDTFAPRKVSTMSASTLSLVGAGFTPQTAVSILSLGGPTFSPTQTHFVDANDLQATFDMTVVPPGDYDVQVSDSGKTSTSADTLEVGTAGGFVSVTILSPAKVHVGATIPVTIDIKNSGFVDAVAPITQIIATGVKSGQNTNQSLASPDDLPGTLPAGYKGKLNTGYEPDPKVDGAASDFGLSLINPTTTVVNWDAQKDSLRPSTIPADAWDAVWDNLKAAVFGNNTLADYYLSLTADAAGLIKSGVSTHDVSRLFSFEVQKADDQLALADIPGAVDAATPAPGLPLVFGRTFGQSVTGRYHLGRLGRGWVDSFDISASVNGKGAVTIRQGDSLRSFGPVTGGFLAINPGDTGALTVVGGAYHLREKDGLLTVFRTDGLVDYIQDTNGNRITAGYSGSQLTTLTQTNGSVLTLTYGAQGRLSQIADSAGRVTTYAYDASGEHLLSVTTPAGTTQYTYTSDTTGPAAHSLATITSPAGTHRFFTYDGHGRLSEQEGDGGAGKLDYVYDVAAFKITDAQGHGTVSYFDDFARITRQQDEVHPLAGTNHDDQNRLTSAGVMGFAPTTVGHDAQGNPSSTVDALGETQDFTYGTAFNRLTSWQDAMTNTTAYGYDGNGNLQATTYADGSSDQFSYDARGNIITSIDRSGQAITYSYDGRGLLV
jgi:YD repeat-containing protein